MSTVDKTIRPEIERVLARLRGKIRSYVFLEGLAWVIVALGAVFWVTLGLNWAYFKVSNLELPVWFRVLVDVAAIAFLAGCLMLWLVQRLLKNIRTKALALVLERRFPELDDRLITAVEAADSMTGKETFFTTTLLNRTIADVTEATRRLEVADVFAKRPLRNAMLMAVVFVASIVGFGMLNEQAMGYWYKAFFGLQEEYWDRETLLVPVVISPADERPKPFRLIDGEYVYKHPRGEDFTLAVSVPTAEESEGKSWVVPEDVEWDYELENNRGGAALSMSKTGDRQFRQTVPNLIDGMEFNIRGNDYVNRRPFRVVIVDPPTITRMVLDCNYPDYTGLNPRFAPDPGEVPSNIKVVDGSLISEPMESEILMQATANKPLVGLKVEGQNFRLTVKAERVNEAGETEPASSKFELLAADGAPLLELPLAKAFSERVLVPAETALEEALKRDANGDGQLSRGEVDGGLTAQFVEQDANEDSVLDEEELRSFFSRRFSLPVKLATDASARLTPRGLPLPSDANAGFLVNPFVQAAEMADWLTTPLETIPLPVSSIVRIYLEDTDDVLSSEPVQLTVNGIIDQPPEQKLEYFGIGDYITPHARIPVRGTITDDFGVAKARFDYQLTRENGQVLTGPGWVAVEFEQPPTTEPKEYPLKRDNGTPETADDEDFERFDVSKILFQDEAGPRGVRPGDVLVLTVYAEDGDNINGPHIVRQKPKPEYNFKIVSSDELLAILFQKELGLLSRFQQIITEIEAVEADLQKGISLSDELNQLRQNNPNVEDEESFKSLTATATRSLQQIGKNESETRAVEASFREIIDELNNNGMVGVDETLHRDIIASLKRIGDNDFPNVGGALQRFRDVHASAKDSRESVQDSRKATQDLIANMLRVKEMIELMIGFHSVTKELKDMIQGTEAAKQQANKEGLEQLNKLKLLD